MEFGSSYILCNNPSEREAITETELQEPLRFDRILSETSCQDVKPKRHATAGRVNTTKDGAMRRTSASIRGPPSRLLTVLEDQEIMQENEESCSKTSREYLALRQCTHALCQNISSVTTAAWFAQKLYEKGIITQQLLNKALVLGISEYEKVAQLLQAVQIQVKERPDKLQRLMETLREESALEDSLSMLCDIIKGKQEGAQYEDLQTTGIILVKPPDTNIVALQINWLCEPHKDHTGDAVKCTNTQCSAVLSHISKVHKQNWQCEFCGKVNEVDVTSEEIPTEPDVTYLLSSPLLLKGTSGTNMAGEAILVFCIDTSGSMCTSTKVPNRLRLNSTVGLENLAKTEGVQMDSQYLPREKKKGTYISRMETVKDALTSQLKKIANSSPSLHVAFISFASEVKVYGDGSHEERTFAGDRLDDVEDLKKKADELPMPKAIRYTQKHLLDVVMGLQEDGMTALGPALLTAIMLAGRVSGSKVVVCTDGCANVGLGNLDDNECRPSAENFYKKLGVMALEKGITVSVITFEGTDCSLSELSHVVHATRGEVVRVDPKDISSEFSSILAVPTIANNASCSIVLHKGLAFSSPDMKSSLRKITLGSVKANTELSYEFEVRGDSSLRNQEHGNPLEVPIQLQVDHLLPDGLHVMRVLTKILPVTRDKETAENRINVSVVSNHAVRSAASLAAQGKFKEARIVALMAERMMRRASKNAEQKKTYVTIMGELVPLDDAIQKKTKGNFYQICSPKEYLPRLDDATTVMATRLRASSQMASLKLSTTTKRNCSCPGMFQHSAKSCKNVDPPLHPLPPPRSLYRSPPRRVPPPPPPQPQLMLPLPTRPPSHVRSLQGYTSDTITSGVDVQLTVDNHAEVVEILKAAKEKWYTLGIRLGIAAVGLDAIDEESTSDTEAKFARMISMWLENGQNCTWQAVNDALHHHIVQLPDLAKKVKEKYMTKKK